MPSGSGTSGGWCEHSGISIPECSCRSCTLRIMREQGAAAADRWMSSADDQPLDSRDTMDLNPEQRSEHEDA